MGLKVDPSKVNVAESDIEEWLWQHPEAIANAGIRLVERWTGRQVRVPSGIIDLLGVGHDGEPVVVEVKNVPLDAKALTQVRRYAFDVERVLMSVDVLPMVKCVVIGRAVDDQTLREAEALDVVTITFVVSYDLTLSSMGWTDQYQTWRDGEYAKLAQSETIETMAQRWHYAMGRSDEMEVPATTEDTQPAPAEA